MSEVPPPQFSQYPRPGYQMSPFGRPPGVYIDAIGDAWTLVKAELAAWVGATLLSGLVVAPFYVFVIWVSLSFGPKVTPADNDLTPLLTSYVFQMAAQLPFSLMVYVVGAGMSNMAIRQVYGEPISATTVFLAFRRFPALVGTNFLFLVVVYIGFLLCFVPGLYLTGALALSQLIALNRNRSPVEALRESFDTLRPHAWMMLLLLFAAGIISGIGVIGCGVGVLVTIPIYHAVIGLHYTYFFPPTPVYQPPPTYGG